MIAPHVVVWPSIREEPFAMHISTTRAVASATLAFALTGLAFSPADASSSAAGPAPSSTLQDQVNAIEGTGSVGVLAETTGPGGSAYATAGAADTATGTPVRDGDAFRAGSLTKTFVATVVLQLVAEGRLSLDDTVAHWLPAVVTGHGNDGARITVRELLEHTSGIYDYAYDLPEIATAAGWQADRFTTYTPEQLIAIAMKHRPAFAPGTAWSYSNTNYVLVGMIIQRVTGHSWQQEVTDRIIRPLGLRHTVAPYTDPLIPGPHLDGYSAFSATFGAPVIDVTAADMTYVSSAGAVISTSADLARFYQALLSGRLLPPAQLAEMETTVPAPDLGSGARYGLGLMWYPLTCGGGVFGHTGTVPGYNTDVFATPDGRHAVAVEQTGPDTDATDQDVTTLIDQQICAAKS
jgi:D-alanyl-D-alanine carboxypeptidase